MIPASSWDAKIDALGEFRGIGGQLFLAGTIEEGRSLSQFLGGCIQEL